MIMLSLIRLSTSFVVLNFTVKMEIRFFSKNENLECSLQQDSGQP